MPAWSKGLIGGVLDKGLMSTDSKKHFQPNKPATRAEVMVVLDRVAKMLGFEQALTIRKAGTYGPDSGVEEVKGDIKVQVEGVMLRNYAVPNQLKLTDAIGNSSSLSCYSA
ncbi:S-layer homology domain-containing protein [Cohnella herbarum]|uniref:S-layer homology domain-containing protein n=1 Tax=Cohnella herbarum TaxID=2728023 RepID=A0A7Z2VPV5_9BACL|nr:S-layer homology domain-containing protein [Cohnella herbarum]QJD87281.1 S-layer homology domain-containing protein [Cohnella herbarum]